MDSKIQKRRVLIKTPSGQAPELKVMVEEKISDIQSIKLVFPEGIRPPKKLSQERFRALKDLTESSQFQPLSNNNDPYSIELSIAENKLIFKIKDTTENLLPILVLSLSPYKRILKDYFMMIDSYEQFRGNATPSKLETIDMARRAIHNEAAEMMIERLSDKIVIDLETARGLFTLLCILYIGNMKTGWL